MGFTVEDMMILAGERYKMKMIAGEHGWANSISWLMMVEDTTITRNFKGKELAVTLGAGGGATEDLLKLAKSLDEHHAAGWIINSGFYIKEVPGEVISFCDEHDLPLVEIPWDIEVSEMMKDLMVRIFLQTETDEQISSAFIRAIESPQSEDTYRESISSAFDVDGRFQVVLITTDGLDSMDTIERKRIGYRLQIYLENISHNAHFFYYDGNFVMILNEITDEQRDEIIDGFLRRSRRRMPNRAIFCGLGSKVQDVRHVHRSYARAVYAVKAAKRKKTDYVNFDSLDIERILYSVCDKALFEEMGHHTLKPVLDYDAKHDADLFETLFSYLSHNGSVKSVAEELFIHKNTIVYRMGKIRELLGAELEEGNERMRLYLACLIVSTQKQTPFIL